MIFLLLIFYQNVKNCCDEENIGIDFSDVRFVFPFGSLMIAEGLKQVFNKRMISGQHVYLTNPEVIDESYNNALSYLKYFGFFKYVGIDKGFEPNQNIYNTSYIPIKTITKVSLKKGSSSEDWYDTINIACENIATIITDDDFSVHMLTYCFREIIRNVFEHAKIDYCSLMAQYYPRNNIVEIAIFDTGIGIYESLKESGSPYEGDDLLEHVIRPGISSKIGGSRNDDWENTGFGLYVISELGKQYGNFSLISSNQYISFEEEKLLIDKINIKGTGIKLKISLNDSAYFPNILKSIVDKGEELTVEIFGERREASGMSKSSKSSK